MLARLLACWCVLLVLGLEVVGTWHAATAHQPACVACDHGDVPDEPPCDLCQALAILGDGLLPQVPCPVAIVLDLPAEPIRGVWSTPTDNVRWRNCPARGPPVAG